MDLRPQAHDIIRTWLFATIVRADAEQGTLPWSHTAISGWILDPERKKLSKSKSNSAVTPKALLDRFGADAVRYWACSARLGVDTAFDVNDPAQIKIGRRLAVKLLNASKFVLGTGVSRAAGAVADPLDAALLAELRGVVAEATAAYDDDNYALALERSERFFWSFCDDYLELVKARAYGEHGDADSARSALSTALSVLLRLFAPALPFVTEEAWSWWQDGSVHHAGWPLSTDLPAGDTAVVRLAADTIAAVRKAKSDAKLSMRADVPSLRVVGRAAEIDRLRSVAADLKAAGRVGEIDFVVDESADGVRHEVVLDA